MCQRIQPSKSFTWEEIQSHNTREDAYIVISNKVYNVSNFDHPGGSVILTHAGEDATDVFAAFHSPSAAKLLKSLYIGDIDKQSVPDEHTQAYRRLRMKVKSLGLYQISISYYMYKIVSTFAIWIVSFAIAMYAKSLVLYLLSGFVMGLFYQQSGWLAHDFLHMRMFKRPSMNNLLGILLGNVWQGLSVQWWKNKHNTHHAIPNLHGNRIDKGDPDIDTMPFLAWSIQMAHPAKDSMISNFLIRNQTLLYFPLLFVARMSWLYQSLWYVFGNFSYLQYDASPTPNIEKFALIVHYVWNIVFVYASGMSVTEGLLWFLFSQTCCGVLLALVFSLGHNGMALYDRDARPNFHTLQVSTTRNIRSSWLCDWFMGGLNFQTDHHLFPLVPRHNLKKLNILVKSFCHEHSVPYHETGFFNGMNEVLSHLSTISTDFCNEFPAM